MSDIKQKRLVNFDIAKAICIILVVIGHYMPEIAPQWYIMNHDFIYSFHMPLFMFASGYIYIAFKKEESYGHFIMKKIRRLMIPYFVTSFLIVTIKLLTEHSAYVENPVTVASYLKVFYSPEAGYFLWFIWALWWMLVFIPILKTKKLRFVGFIVAVVLHYVPVSLTSLFCFEQARQMFVFFMFGVVAYDYKDYYIKYARTFFLPLLVAFVGCEYAGLNRKIGGGCVAEWFTPYLGIIIVMYVSTWLANCRNLLVSKILCYIAPSTYIIYLFHTTFEGFAKAIVHKFPILASSSDGILFIAGACLVIVSGIAGPLLMYKYILIRFRVTRWMFGLK